MKIADASIIGSIHRNLNYNNQDALHIIEEENFTIGIVADGCGSGSYSEVGARLGVSFIANYIHQSLLEGKNWKNDLAQKIANYTQHLSDLHTNNTRSFVHDFCLYTIIGVVIQKGKVTFFSSGDGIFGIGNDLNIIDQNNRPKYINNHFLKDEKSQFEFWEKEVNNNEFIFIGTDGVEDFIEGIKKGEVEEYKSFYQFLTDENMYKNPVFFSKLFEKYSQQELLRDDTSMIVFI